MEKLKVNDRVKHLLNGKCGTVVEVIEPVPLSGVGFDRGTCVHFDDGSVESFTIDGKFSPRSEEQLLELIQ